jgi:hypothetical protein
MADLTYDVHYSKKDSKLRIDAILTNLNNPEDVSVLNNIFFTAGYDDPNHVGVTITGSGVKDDLTAEMIESVQVSANTIFWEMSYESNTENNTVNGIINVNNADYLEYPFVFQNKKTIQQTEYHNSITDITESGGTVWFALMMYEQDEVLEDTPMNEVFESVAFDSSILLPYSINYKHKEIEQHSTSTMVNSSASQYKDFYVDRFVTNYQTYFSQNDLHNAKIVLYFGIFNVEQANTVNVAHSLDFINPTTFAPTEVLANTCFYIENAFIDLDYRIKNLSENYLFRTGDNFKIGLSNVQNHYKNYFMEIDIDGNKIYKMFESNTALVSLSSIDKRTHTIRVFDESGIYMTNDPIVVDCEYNTVKKREFVQKEFENKESENNYPNQRIITFY